MSMQSDSYQQARARYYTTHFKAFQSPEMDVATFRYYQEKLGSTLPVDKTVPILEVGCGLGKFLATLEQLGYSNMRGVDPSGEMVELARQNTGAPIAHAADVPAYLAAVPDGELERIYMLDVIEHVEKSQVVPLVTSLHAKLRPGGMLVVTTENMASPIGRIQRYLDFTHEYNYTELTLQQVLQLGGFERVQVFGSPDPIRFRPRPLMSWLARRAWFTTLDFLNRIERPGCWRPSILGKDLIACATA
jgi:2-polyprenyl-3-methyl-5-hydroxy-6-metoxy-1,4-benzoquinol methylase